MHVCFVTSMLTLQKQNFKRKIEMNRNWKKIEGVDFKEILSSSRVLCRKCLKANSWKT